MVGNKRRRCSALRSLRAEDVAKTEGGASFGIGVLVPLLMC